MISKIFVAIIFLFPFMGHAQVIFSEIAWMGTDADANNEWIELYNMGGPVDLAGWTITDGGSLSIPLTGTLDGPHKIGVLERTDDDTLPGPAFLIYTGALANSGATLSLKDASGAEVDKAVGGTDWAGIGGSNVVPKMTPQRTRTASWVTGVPTPGADNVQENATVVVEESNPDTNTQTSSNTVARTSSGGGGSSSPKKAAVIENPVLALTVNAPKVAYVNQPVEFEAIPSGIGKTLMNSLSYDWNFGDTYTEKGKKNSHVFEYPGEYIVVAHGEFAKQKAIARHEITVLPMSLSISRTAAGDVILTNSSKHEMDLGGFSLVGETKFMFPKFTFLKAGGSMTIASKRITAQMGSVVALYDVLGVLAVADGQVTVPKVSTIGMVKPTPQKTASFVSEVPVVEEVVVEENQAVSIPIGKRVADEEIAGEGSFKKFFSRVFGFLGL